MNNLALYDRVRECPQEAIKKIGAGRLKGMSDINPMWRIKKLTEEFGVCGIGWYIETTRQWIERDGDGESAAFVNINLHIKQGGEWSKPIQGTGGSKFATNEKSGRYVSDEAFKMALTDAISVACKMLGFAADVYWQNDSTKYSGNSAQESSGTDICPICGQKQKPIRNGAGQVYDGKQVIGMWGCCFECRAKWLGNHGQNE